MAKDEIGRKLRQLRIQKNLTLKQMSEGVDLSVGYLSQVERGKSSISINQLAKIAGFLETNIEYFITEEHRTADIVTHNYERSVLHIENGLSIEYMITQTLKDKTMMPKLVELQPGFHTEPYHAHEGEEFLYVLEGVMELHVGGMSYVLYPNDTAYYESTQEHYWANNTNQMMRAIYVGTPNPFYKMEEEEL